MSDILDINTNSEIINIDVDLSQDDNIMDLTIGENLIYENDYLKLSNKPSINGIELVDNYNEIDPTIPSWAKEPTKPIYTPTEVGAIPVTSNISIEELSELFNM